MSRKEEVSRVVVWFDDETGVRERIESSLRRKGTNIELVTFRDLQTLRRDAGVIGHYSRDVPFVAFVVLSELPAASEVREAIGALGARGVISDLEIRGDALAGLTLLSTLSSLHPRPELALCSSRIDPSVRRLAEGIGITRLVEKRDQRGIVTLVNDLLGLETQGPSEHLDDVKAKCSELRRQNLKLQREKRALTKRLEAVSTTKARRKITGLTTPPESDSGEHHAALKTFKQMVFSHNHDLANTSSLTLTTLNDLCSDPSVIPPVLAGDLQRARITAKHCDVLVQSLASLSGLKSLPATDSSSVAEAISDACEILRRRVPESVKLQTQSTNRLPQCSIPAHLLIRALLNLMLNALEAMPKGGTLTISANRSQDRTHPIRLKVRDTGIGIRKTDLTKLFNAEFSTKGKGHGYGLLIVQQIVHDFGGIASVESKRGRGTTVILRLRAL